METNIQTTYRIMNGLFENPLAVDEEGNGVAAFKQKKASGPKSKNKSTISHCELWPCTTKRYWIKFH